MFEYKWIIWWCVYALTLPLLFSCNGLIFDNLGFLKNLRKKTNEMEVVQMIYYKGIPGNGNVSYNYSLSRSEELMKHIDMNKPFVLYIHGFEEHPFNESIRTIVSAYLERGTDNIIVLDWSALAFHNYISVFLTVKDISKATSKALENLANAGLNVDTLHIIGHSLGAQIAGFMGGYLNFTISRVTGLDPANPLFYQLTNSQHIDKKSGRQVDIIHTDSGIYGAYPDTGTVDFYPNGGIRPQPGCQLFGFPLSPRALCSHWRSWRFYAESVINTTAFPALQCESYARFLKGKCKNNQIVYCGYSLPKNASGRYYFTTNDEAPYGRGVKGIKTKN